MANDISYAVSGMGTLPEPNAPLFVLGDNVVYPYSLTPLSVEGPANTAAVAAAMRQRRQLALFCARPAAETDGTPGGFEYDVAPFQEASVGTVGTLLRIVKKLDFPDGSCRILVRGLRRIDWVRPAFNGGIPVIPVHDRADSSGDGLEGRALRKSLLDQFQELCTCQSISDELRVAVLNVDSPERLADMLAENLGFDYPERLTVLALPTVLRRMEYLVALLNRSIEIARVGGKIQNEVRESMGRQQREFYLREQLRAIQLELGEETANPDLAELRKRMAAMTLPDKVVDVVNKELSRLETMPVNAPEYHIGCTYIDWLLEVPWSVRTEDRLEVAEAAKVLDADHYGLSDVKERILEFLSVLQLKKDRKSPILCLVGPPGVGKTSLGQSIARALNRKFVRVALGGVRDEAEIRGHRRTYVGAMPGRIIQNLKKAGSANPVFMLDEIDKLANDVRGDPASALLEVLDPAQNNAFNDHYLELDFDLSEVFFIATANLLDTIPAPLRDRMEIIRLPGYTSFEKREIARRYLAPRQIRENGLKSRQIRITLNAIDEMIDFYTREAGVRQLERTIARVCRKIARRIVEEKIDAKACTSVDSEMVRALLGARKFLSDDAEESLEAGCATGMAWTDCGGVILPIEALAMPGKGGLKLTGSLGKVMQESAEAAFSLVRSLAPDYGIAADTFEKNDFHIHVPDGATPKDGPSAGITLATALLSLLTGRPVAPRLAMTGEITLRGRVTAIGGVREKVIAALRAGIRRIVMPEENRKDADELPEEVRRQLEFTFVRRFSEVAAVALTPSPRIVPDEGENQEMQE